MEDQSNWFEEETPVPEQPQETPQQPYSAPQQETPQQPYGNRPQYYTAPQQPAGAPQQMDPRMAAYQNYYRNAGPARNEKGKKIGNSMGMTSLVLGVISLLCFLTTLNLFTGLLAVIFGIIQLVSYDQKKAAIIGIACAAVSVVLTFGSYGAILSNDNLAAMVQQSMENGTLQDEVQDYLMQMDGMNLIEEAL